MYGYLLGILSTSPSPSIALLGKVQWWKWAVCQCASFWWASVSFTTFQSCEGPRDKNRGFGRTFTPYSGIFQRRKAKKHPASTLFIRRNLHEHNWREQAGMMRVHIRQHLQYRSEKWNFCTRPMILLMSSTRWHSKHFLDTSLNYTLLELLTQCLLPWGSEKPFSEYTMPGMTYRFCANDKPLQHVNCKKGASHLGTRSVLHPTIVNWTIFMVKECTRRVVRDSWVDSSNRELKVVSLLPINFQVPYQGFNLTREQFPIRFSYAGTVHKGNQKKRNSERGTLCQWV